MNITTALRKRDEAISSLRDLYNRAEHFGLTSDQINSDYNAIVERLAKCPRWVRDYLSGYRAALTDQAYRSQLVYGAMIDGRFYSTHRDRDDYYEKNGFSPREFSEEHEKSNQTGHYWKKTLKPFFISH